MSRSTRQPASIPGLNGYLPPAERMAAIREMRTGAQPLGTAPPDCRTVWRGYSILAIPGAELPTSGGLSDAERRQYARARIAAKDWGARCARKKIVPKRVKEMVRGRSGGHCHYCGNRVPEKYLLIDHVVPVSRGGRSVLSNLVAACHACNADKCDLLPEEWLSDGTVPLRRRAGFARLRSQGRSPAPGGAGGRAFGFEIDGITPHPTESGFLRETVRRLLRGDTVAACCQAAADAGITSTTGHPLTYKTLQRILLRPRTAGLLADRMPGSWEGILTPSEQAELTRLFRDHVAQESPNVKYLLSGISSSRT